MQKQVQKRLGTIAVEKGFITTDQLAVALAIQAKENVEEGQHRLLGQILLEQELLTESQIDEILETMTRSMEYIVSAGR